MAAAAALAVAVGMAAFVVQDDDEDAGAPPMTTKDAGAEAASACAQLRRFEQLVAQDAPVDRVLEVLREAESSAERAAQGDPAWLALSGGVTSLRIALKADDERVARTGVDVVRTECRRAG